MLLIYCWLLFTKDMNQECALDTGSAVYRQRE
jgi:hypothetical protein